MLYVYVNVKHASRAHDGAATTEETHDVRAQPGPRGLPQGRPRLRRAGGRPEHRQVGRRVATSRPTSCPRWATSACSASSCRRSSAAPARAATSPASASRSRSSAASTSRSASPCRRGSGLGINPILTYGTQEQKERFLPDLVAGRALAGFGLTEPEAGSDAGATRTRAVRDGDEWVLDGAKAFITNSGTDITSVVTVTARTGTNEDGSAQISAIMVPAGTPGFTRRAGLPQARLARLRHPRPHLRGLPRAGRQPPR